MVIQRVPQLTDRMTQRFIAAVAIAPDFVEQFLPGIQLTRPAGQMQQHFRCLGWQMPGGTLACHPPFERFDQHITQIKSVQ